MEIKKFSPQINPSEVMSSITTHMKYAKYLPNEKRRETWDELVTRNKTMHLNKFKGNQQILDDIESVYENLVRTKKILPSMRSFQFAGKPIEVNPTRMFNCAFAACDAVEVFSEALFLLLGGTGFGFSVQTHHINKLPPILGPEIPMYPQRKKRYLVGDSIEGWADAVKILMESYFYEKREVEFDFSDIRQKGAILITAGGHAPGPEPLKKCIESIREVLDSAIAERGRNTKLKSIEIHDIMCHIALSVKVGGIRRAATISFFSPDDISMLNAKHGEWGIDNPQRALANNSAVLNRKEVTKEQFLFVLNRTELSGSGEPGIYFTNHEDWASNPCLTGDSIIDTRIGGIVGKTRLDELISLHNSGVKIEVVSFNESTKELEYRKVTWGDKTRKNAEIIRITTEEGNTLRLTPDHKVYTENRGWIEAKSLSKDDTILEY